MLRIRLLRDIVQISLIIGVVPLPKSIIIVLVFVIFSPISKVVLRGWLIAIVTLLVLVPVRIRWSIIEVFGASLKAIIISSGELGWTTSIKWSTIAWFSPFSELVLLFGVEGDSSELIERWIDKLIGLLQDLDEIIDKAKLLLCDERVRGTFLTCSARPSNPMHVVLDASRHVIIDDHRDVFHVKTS